MGRRVDVFCLIATSILTLLTTVMMSITVISSHWESIHFSRYKIETILNRTGGILTEELFEGRVLVIKNSSSDEDSNLRGNETLLVSLHGGLWSVCIDLSGKIQK